MVRKEMIAMLLAGGQGSRLGVLTQKVAKPAVSFGGKYRIIDFPLSNCINSGVDTVGVLTQYQPLRLNTHIGIGIPWDLNRNVGGVIVLPPYERSKGSDWYTGTANAIYQNLEYMNPDNPEYVLILSGDHIYKMDYEVMLEYHKANNADVTIAAMPVPMEEASRFGILITDDANRITEFEEKPANPRSNLASMGIYIFSWKVLKEALIKLKDEPGCDFGKHIIPYCHNDGRRIFAYEYNGYWKDVGTLGSYWEANMELIDIIPEFNLYEEYWKIYTKSREDPAPVHFRRSEGRKEHHRRGDGDLWRGHQFRHRLWRCDRKGRCGPGFHHHAGFCHRGRRRGGQGHCGRGRADQRRRPSWRWRIRAQQIRSQGIPVRPGDRRRAFSDPGGRGDRKEHGDLRCDRSFDYPDGKLESGGYIVKAGGNIRAIGIVLAGGNSKRMRELSRKRAIAAMPIAGSFRSVDFALSNMSNSHIQSVAVLTQYNSRSLNEHLSSSKWWDFGRKQGACMYLPAHHRKHSDWYRGTADAFTRTWIF